MFQTTKQLNCDYVDYPLVNVYITNWKITMLLMGQSQFLMGKSQFLMGKSTISNGKIHYFYIFLWFFVDNKPYQVTD